MNEQKKGLFLGITAYILWGIIPLYWKLLPTVNPLDILCYRIIWSFVFMIFYILFTGKKEKFMMEVKKIYQNKKQLLAIIAASLLISINWFTFIYTVSQGHVTEASLGYYMNPLVNVLLATVVLKERLNRTGLIACLLALTGVILLSIQTGTIPVASLIMAFSFSTYGLIKKSLPITSYTGLTIETLVMLPIACIYLLLFSTHGFMNYAVSINCLLIGAGIVTAIPLLLFAEAAKRISYIILGFIQYVNPTIMLLFAIFVFHEPYTIHQFIAFGFIWVAIAVFTYGNVYTYIKERRMQRMDH